MLSKRRLINQLLPKKRFLPIVEKFPLDYCIPVYHTVSDEVLPHLKHLINYKNTQNFLKDLEFFSKNFQWLTWDEFQDFVNGNFKPKKKVALLTFDDGLREFSTVIAPILEQKGIYAINFINPAFIGNTNLMFRCKASLLVDKIQNESSLNPAIFSSLKMKIEDKKSLIQKILNIKFQNQHLLDELAPFLGIDFQQYAQKKQPYLSISEMKDLEKRGFGFGAHSMNHPLFHDISKENQLEETKNSLEFLEKNGFKADTFAFPFTDFGVSQAFFDELFQQKNDLFCTFGCAGIKTDDFSKNFQRIPMENGLSAEETTEQEMKYFWLKKWFNKNNITRK